MARHGQPDAAKLSSPPVDAPTASADDEAITLGGLLGWLSYQTYTQVVVVSAADERADLRAGGIRMVPFGSESVSAVNRDPSVSAPVPARDWNPYDEELGRHDHTTETHRLARCGDHCRGHDER